MPYLNVRIAQQESAGVADQVVSALMKRTAEILGKKPEVTSIEIDFISPDRWFVGHVRISDQDARHFIWISRSRKGPIPSSRRPNISRPYLRILNQSWVASRQPVIS